MISPELAKAVLGWEHSKLKYSDGKIIACYINIHELANKCKEWVHVNYKIQLHTSFNEDKVWCQMFKDVDKQPPECISATYNNTIPKAILAAAEWLLSKKRNNGNS